MRMKRKHERMASALAASFGVCFVCTAMVHALAGFVSDWNVLPLTLLSLFAGLCLSASAFALYARLAWGWKADVGGHLLAMLASIMAIVMSASSALASVALVLLMLSLLTLWKTRPRTRAADTRAAIG